MKTINNNFKFHKGYNWIDLSILPRKKTKTREQIEWDKSIGFSVEYFFEGNEGFIKIKDCYRRNDRRYLVVESRDEKHEILAMNFKNCEIKKIVTDGFNHEIGFIINGCKVIGKRLNPRSKERDYKMLCLQTNKTFYRRESRIDNGSPSPYVSGKYVYEGNWLFNEKHILPFLKNEEDAKTYTKYARREIECVCPNCKSEKKMAVNNLVSQGFFCHMCSSNIPYPERVMIALLNENEIVYKYQKVFTKLKLKRFDFYLPDYDVVIETHGKQHYEEFSAWYKKTHESDVVKKSFCENNNISYVEVDCRTSNFDFIIKNINKTILKDILVIHSREKLIKRIKDLEKIKDVDKIIDLHLHGKGNTYISRKIGITTWKVEGLLSRLGYINQ